MDRKALFHRIQRGDPTENTLLLTETQCRLIWPYILISALLFHRALRVVPNLFSTPVSSPT